VGTNCFNYPVAPRTHRADYRKVLQRALDDLQKARPDLVAVSAGFDAYARDPLAQETLELEDFHWLGGSFRKLGAPTLTVRHPGVPTLPGFSAGEDAHATGRLLREGPSPANALWQRSKVCHLPAACSDFPGCRRKIS
jgi:hypothetical protein